MMANKIPKYDDDFDYVSLCGWNDYSHVIVADAFIAERGLTDEYERYMNERAYEELVECGHFDEEFHEDDDS